MLTYNNLVASLEAAWVESGLHEHELVESVQPDSHDRTYRAELFPEHPDPLDEESIPPWVEVSFTWTALHQLRSEGHSFGESSTALDLTWVYNIIVRDTLNERSDQELVRLFRRSVYTALRTYYPEATEDTPIAVEIRRIYHSDGQNLELAYIQLVSPNITDLSDQWTERDPLALRSLIQSELDLASAVINALEQTFNPGGGGHGIYRSVDTA